MKAKMLFNMISKNKTRKIIALFLGCVLIVVLCCTEKMKRTTPYGMVFYEMGLQCEDRCGQDRVVQYFKKAVRHDPNLSGAHYQLALIFEKMGKHAESLEHFKRVTELDDLNILASYRVGLQYFKEESYDLALKHLLRTHNRIGSPDRLDYYLARAYDQTQEYYLASQHYRKAVWVHAEYADEAYQRLAEISKLLGNQRIIDDELFWLRESSKHDLADKLERAVNAVKVSETAD